MQFAKEQPCNNGYKALFIFDDMQNNWLQIYC